MPSPLTTPEAAPEFASPLPHVVSERLVSLDAFRGLTMAFMVVVNAGSENIYPVLRHAAWNGWTIADTIFPSFLWIVGVAITLSIGKRLERGAPRSQLFLSALRRSAILYAMGLLIYALPHFNLATQRVLGVLQRIAICYLAASAIYLTTRVRAQVWWIIGLFAAYWACMMLIPVPGYGAGNLTVEGNFAHYLDRIVLGAHNYASTKTWDPEGIVSTLPSIATTLLGILCGHILRLKKPLSERVVWLFVLGVCLLGGGLICDAWLPINKKLWTPSFALFMAGLDFLVFAMLAWLVDGCRWRRPVRPLAILGMNAIAIYMASELLEIAIGSIRVGAGESSVSIRGWVFAHFFAPFAAPAPAALLYAVAYACLMYVIAYLLYRRQWFLRV